MINRIKSSIGTSQFHDSYSFGTVPRGNFANTLDKYGDILKLVGKFVEKF